MSKYFAEIDKNNIVTRVVVADSLDWCIEHLGGTWTETFMDDSEKNYAGVGYTFNQNKINFLSPKPYPSWIKDEVKEQWKPPVAKPINMTRPIWDEATTSFVDVALISVSEIV